jgi:DNA-directed RNA polymerase subunit RPC12/RpoP
MKVKVPTRYKDDTEWYERDDELYCPNCGHKGTVWSNCIGDYYEGFTYLCVQCGSNFTMPRLEDGGDYKKQVEAIRQSLQSEGDTWNSLTS